MQSTQLNRDGTRYWVYGPDAAPGVPVLIAVHGFRGDHHGLEQVFRELPGIRVIAPDLPGFGLSEPFPDRPHDIDAYVDWLAGFISATADDAGPITVLGHSFGSIVVAAALAAGRLPQAANAVLVNPIGQPALEGPQAIGTNAAIFYYWLGRTLPERAGNALLRNRAVVRAMSIAMTKARSAELRGWIHEQHDRYFSLFSSRSMLLEAFRASVSHDVGEYAARIGTRTLLIAAELDQITPVAVERELVHLFPDATLAVIPAVGHLIHYEAPAVAAGFIEAFLAAEAAHPEPLA